MLGLGVYHATGNRDPRALGTLPRLPKGSMDWFRPYALPSEPLGLANARACTPRAFTVSPPWTGMMYLKQNEATPRRKQIQIEKPADSKRKPFMPRTQPKRVTGRFKVAQTCHAHTYHVKADPIQNE